MGINALNSFNTAATSDWGAFGVTNNNQLENTIDALANQSGTNEMTLGILQNAASATKGNQQTDILALTGDLTGVNTSNPSGVVLTISGSSFVSIGGDGIGGGGVSSGPAPFNITVSPSGSPQLKDPNGGKISLDSAYPSGALYFDQNAFGVTGLVLFARMTSSGPSFYLNEPPGANNSVKITPPATSGGGIYQFALLPSGSTAGGSGILTSAQNVISYSWPSGMIGTSGTDFNGVLAFDYNGGLVLPTNSTNLNLTPTDTGDTMTTPNGETILLNANASGFQITNKTTDNILIKYGPSGVESMTDVGNRTGSGIVKAGSNMSFSWSASTAASGTGFKGSWSFDYADGINPISGNANFISTLPVGDHWVLTTMNSGTVSVMNEGPSGFGIEDNTSDNIKLTYEPSGIVTITDVGSGTGDNIVKTGSTGSFSWSGSRK